MVADTVAAAPAADASTPADVHADSGSGGAAAVAPTICGGTDSAPALSEPVSTVCSMCQKPSTLTCPTCKKLGLAPSYFCGKVCFQAAWPTHKLQHKKDKPSADVLSPQDPRDPRMQLFEGVNFTGAVRPFAVTPQMRVTKPGIDLPDYALSGVPVSELSAKMSRTIEVNTPAQIDALRRVCRLGREVLDVASAAVAVGVTADAIDKVVFAACMERDCYPSPLNYKDFPKSVCISVNEVICHGIPDLRPLQDGDIVNIDVSVFKDGVHADLNETYLVGAVDADARALVRTSYESLRAAVATVRPGQLYRDVGAPIERVARAGKCSVVTAYVGHGIGTLFHCAPDVPHYKKNKAVGVMKPGHVFTIEPMINRGTHHDLTWPDDWTSVTRDGKWSAQFEHTLLVTEQGVEVLTARQGEPNDVMPEFNEETFQR
jgi:methionyl aminopeptidase